MDRTDTAAVLQIKSGNIDAFGVLVDKYTTRIRSFVVQKLFDKDEADDIVQNAFIQLYKALSRLEMTKPIYPYLLQITRNELNMYFRKHHTTVSLNEDIILTPDKTVPDDISHVLQGLKKDHKVALVWFSEGYSYQEISHRMGKPINTIRTLIRRARLYIKKNYT